MRKKLFNNIFLKIISVILAFILWLVLVNVSDPTTKITISGVSVHFENESEFLDKGYTYSVVDGSKISVDVSGPKSKITSLSSSDIQAVVDLSQVSAFSDYANIKVSAVQNGKTVKDVKLTPKTSSVKLSIDNRASKDFTVDAHTKGNVKSGYVISNISASPDSIKIAGPEAEVNSIASVRAEVDVSNAEGSISSEATLKLYDANGNEVRNSDIELSRTNVKVTVDIKKTKTVPIKYSTSGSPADGYTVKEINISQNQAIISGSEDILNKITQIQLPSSSLDISGISASKTFSFLVSDYVPEGASVVSQNSITVEVVVEPAS